MRVPRFAALALSAAFLGACGGAERPATDAATPADAATPPPAAAPTGTATAAPITGTTHVVRMIGDAQGYRYEPANLTVRAGDGVRFINVSGFPHDITFQANEVVAAGRAQLNANMQAAPQGTRAELTSPLFVTPNEEYVISFGNVAAGRYPFVCTPHLAMGMRGEITVQ